MCQCLQHWRSIVLTFDRNGVVEHSATLPALTRHCADVWSGRNNRFMNSTFSLADSPWTAHNSPHSIEINNHSSAFGLNQSAGKHPYWYCNWCQCAQWRIHRGVRGISLSKLYCIKIAPNLLYRTQNNIVLQWVSMNEMAYQEESWRG